MALTSGASISASTASLSPLITLSTPRGRPASCSSWAMNRVGAGVALGRLEDEGSCRRRWPAGTSTAAPCAGKLNGVMPATTPSGWKSLQLSMFGPTLRLYSPLSSSGAPQAYSTFSMPRCSSPTASSRVLPCSSLISAAILSLLASSSCLKRNMTWARLAGGVLRQAGKAALAESMAAWMVPRSASSTWRTGSPMDGLKTGAVRWPLRTMSPLIRWAMVLMELSLVS